MAESDITSGKLYDAYTSNSWDPRCVYYVWPKVEICMQTINRI